MTDQRKQYRLYASLTDEEIHQIAAEWLQAPPTVFLSRWLNGWLLEHDFTWDPSVGDEDNRNQFEAVLSRVHAALDHIRSCS